MVLKTSALIYEFLLYLNPVKVQCYRIAYVHNHYSIRSTTILWKILYLILFGHIKSDFERYLIWICLKSQLDKLTVIEMVQDIESVSQRDWFICHIFCFCGFEIITL